MIYDKNFEKKVLLLFLFLFFDWLLVLGDWVCFFVLCFCNYGCFWFEGKNGWCEIGWSGVLFVLG